MEATIWPLRHAGIGVAMGNAGDEVKEAADYVTDSVDDDGVMNALRHFDVIINKQFNNAKSQTL